MQTKLNYIHVFFSKGNTALHEAVSLGPPGAKVVEALLRSVLDNLRNISYNNIMGTSYIRVNN